MSAKSSQTAERRELAIRIVEAIDTLRALRMAVDDARRTGALCDCEARETRTALDVSIAELTESRPRLCR